MWAFGTWLADYRWRNEEWCDLSLRRFDWFRRNRIRSILLCRLHVLDDLTFHLGSPTLLASAKILFAHLF